MRKRFEEELSKLAFGDLDVEEARRLEMQTLSDPEASQTFQTYCRMKEELRSLAQDVPADQLSKERLREAILNRGMKEPLPRSAKPTWVWMPAMAAVLAFGFMFVKGQLAGQAPTVVVNNSKARPNVDLPNFGVDAPVAAAKPAPTTVRKPNLVVEKPPMTVASNVGRSNRDERSYDNITDRNQASREMPVGVANLDLKSQSTEGQELTQTMFFGGEKKDPAVRDMAFAPMAATGTPAPPATIVVIQSETDADTGTLKAKEVSSTANVIVGG
jgi:hypothetical protein